MAASLRHILLLQRDVPAAAHFYKEGLGLTVSKIVTDKWAELDAGDCLFIPTGWYHHVRSSDRRNLALSVAWARPCAEEAPNRIERKMEARKVT